MACVICLKGPLLTRSGHFTTNTGKSAGEVTFLGISICITLKEKNAVTNSISIVPDRSVQVADDAQ